MIFAKFYLLSLLVVVHAFPIATLNEVYQHKASATVTSAGNGTSTTVSNPTSTIASLAPLFEGNQQFLSKTRLEAERDSQQGKANLFISTHSVLFTTKSITRFIVYAHGMLG